jgi:hypothetical protein
MNMGQRVRIALYLVAGLCGAWVLLRADRPDVDAVLWQRQVTAMHRQAQAFHAKQDSLTRVAASAEAEAARLARTADSLKAHPTVVRVPAPYAADTATAVAYRQGYADGAASREPEVVKLRAAYTTEMQAAAAFRVARDSAVGRADSLQTLVDKAPHPKRGINRTIVFVGGVVVGHLLLH